MLFASMLCHTNFTHLKTQKQRHACQLTNQPGDALKRLFSQRIKQAKGRERREN